MLRKTIVSTSLRGSPPGRETGNNRSNLMLYAKAVIASLPPLYAISCGTMTIEGSNKIFEKHWRQLFSCYCFDKTGI